MVDTESLLVLFYTYGLLEACFLHRIAVSSAKCIIHISESSVDFEDCQATAANELLMLCSLKQHTEWSA